ncbi:MAG: MnhB domain-containing protein [Eubacteriales bacterium]|nr:MnhB domain-containing protein [Eubacteriales bacterium]
MSKRVSDEKYEKTLSFRFKQWFEGSKDPYLDVVEMKKQEERPQIQRHEQEERTILERVYDIEHNAKMRLFQKIYRVFSIVFCISLVFILLAAISHLPAIGTEERPINNEVSQRYIENGLQETGAVNIVTGMILDYRAFDTLGESHVLFIATGTVLILLRKEKKKKEQEVLEFSDRIYEPKNDVILQTVARVLVPTIMIFGIYIILAGHLGPGGGFSGGAVIGAGLILYLNAFGFKKTERFFNMKIYQRMSLCALACYSICKSYSFYTGANEIHSIIPLGTPGAILSSGLILILNICVGTVVAGTMFTFYAMFRKAN